MKALAACSSSVKSALNCYNKAAMELDPPAPVITWQQIIDLTLLADCAIHCGSRRHIIEQAWTKPENRWCVEQYHRLLHAQEEVERLNIEMQRLLTSIADEACILPAKVTEVYMSNPALGWAVQKCVDYWLAVNTAIVRKLAAIQVLKGYSGDWTNGICIGHVQEGK